MRSSRSLLRQGLQISFLQLCNLLLNFTGLLILAYLFGTSDQQDALIVATFVPQLIFGWLIYIVDAGFLAIFTKAVATESPLLCQAFFSRALIYLGAAIVALGLAGYAVSFLIYPLVFSNLTPEALAQTRELAPWYFLVFALQVLTQLCNAVVLAHGQAPRAALRGLIVPFVNVFFLALLARRGPIGVAWTDLAKGLTAFLFAAWLVRSLGYRISLPRQGEGEGDYLRRVGRQLRPMVLGILLNPIVPTTERNLTQSFGPGTMSARLYAGRLWDVFGMISAPVNSVFGPQIAADLGRNDLASVRRHISLTLRYLFLLGSCGVVVVWTSGQDAIRLIFERGSFTSASTARTFELLRVLALGAWFTPFSALNLILGYAIERPWRLFVVQVVPIPIFALLAPLLARLWGPEGVIAASFTIPLAQLAVGEWSIRAANLALSSRAMWACWLRTLAAAAGATTLAWLLLPADLGLLRWARMPLGVLLWAGLLWALRTPELGGLARIVQQRLRMLRAAPEPTNR